MSEGVGKRDQIVSRLYCRVPMGLRQRLSGVALLSAYYHMVADVKPPYVRYLFDTKTRSEFARDLDMLLKTVVPIGARDVLEAMSTGRRLPQRAFLLTFDDGFREMHENVAPVLLSKGVPAVFFVPTAFLDNRRLALDQKVSLLVDRLFDGSASPRMRERWPGLRDPSSAARLFLSLGKDREHVVDAVSCEIGLDYDDMLTRFRPYLTAGQVLDLIKKGFAIGAHSIDHPMYASLPLDEQVAQTAMSVEEVRKRFGLDYALFAFPYGDTGLGERFFGALTQSYSVDLMFGTERSPQGAPSIYLPRFSLERGRLPADQLIALYHARLAFRRLAHH